MPLPKFLHPLTADSKRLKITFILALLTLITGFIYFALSGKNGANALLSGKPPPKNEPGAYNQNNQQLLRDVYYQGADNQTIAEKNAALAAQKNQEGNSNPEANRQTEEAIQKKFDAERQAKLDQQKKVSDFQERLRKFMETPHTQAEIQEFTKENAPAPEANTGGLAQYCRAPERKTALAQVDNDHDDGSQHPDRAAYPGPDPSQSAGCSQRRI